MFPDDPWKVKAQSIWNLGGWVFFAVGMASGMLTEMAINGVRATYHEYMNTPIHEDLAVWGARKVDFGKHAELTFEELYVQHPSYINWARGQVAASTYLMEILHYARFREAQSNGILMQSKSSFVSVGQFVINLLTVLTVILSSGYCFNIAINVGGGVISSSAEASTTTDAGAVGDGSGLRNLSVSTTLTLWGFTLWSLQ